MSNIKNLIAEIHAEINKLESGAADRLRGLFDKLTGHLPQVEAEVKTDAEKVAHDAVAAEKPVEAEAVHDAEKVAGDTAAAVTEAAAAPAAETKTA